MLIVGERLYCATGVDRNQPKDKGETAVFCLDAATGKQIWKAPAPYPVWSKPVVKDGFAYITTGNGDVFDDAPPPEVPGGALLCLDAETGKEKWRFKTPNGLIEAPAVDEGRIYFGCRDGNLYCVGRADGKKRWSHFLESPIIATPVLDVDPQERTISVFALAAAGKVCCLQPHSGDIAWTYDLAKQNAYLSTSPALVVTRTKTDARRQLYFGAGLGGGTRDLAANVPVFYCLEDAVKVE
jgi:outer membrane protein assembly factor BamB